MHKQNSERRREKKKLMNESMKKCSFGIELGEINFCFQASLQQPAFLFVLCGSRESGGLWIYLFCCVLEKKSINSMFLQVLRPKGMITDSTEGRTMFLRGNLQPVMIKCSMLSL